MTIYELNLPVFRKGDDLSACLEESHGDVKEAFKFQAEAYEEAARLCRRMAGVALEYQGVAVEADHHMIMVNGPVEVMDRLAADGLLSKETYDILPDDSVSYDDVGEFEMSDE